MPRAILCLVLALLASGASADTALQLTAPNLRAPDDQEVSGIRFALLHGDTRSVRGLDLGLASLSESVDLEGVRLVMGASLVKGDMTGGDFSFFNIHQGHDAGVNAAFVNLVHDTKRAVNMALLNVADRATMLDFGGVNVSQESGVQIGFVNTTRRITGLQIGFINVAENGFLPFFPFFNFPKD